MSNIKNIKTKLDSLSNMKQLFRSMESADYDKLNKITRQFLCYKSFMEDFFSIIWSVDFNLFKQKNNWLTGKKLILVFSTDKWFCGDYNCRLFKSIYSEYFDCVWDVDVFCIGKKAFEFFAKKWFNIVWYLKLGDDFSQDDLSELYDYFISGISNNLYSDISVYLNFLKNKANSGTANYNLYPVDECSLSLFMDNLWISMANISIAEWTSLSWESEKFKIEMEKQLLQYMLYWAALQNRMAELNSRISVLQNMKSTSDYIVKDLRLSFNKICQSLLSREISNIMELKASY